MESFGDHLKAMIRVFRRECHKVLNSERTTVHGADSMLLVLQLAMAEVNKQHCGEFTVALSDVLMAWKHLVLDKLHLPPPFAPAARSQNYELIREAYGAFLKRSNAVDLLDILNMYQQMRDSSSDPEEPISPVQLFEFLSGNSAEVSKITDSQVPSTPSTTNRPFTLQVKMAVRRVFCSYLSLLVNSKNDMALASTLDVPDRALGRQAFTDLKHSARKANTSLFLAVTSFVRAIQLGGKGYAPAEADPLRKHVKGLSDFVQFVDNLEDILGEVPDPSACGSRLVSTIRAVLVKGRSSEDPVYAACEVVTQELKERICQIHQIHKDTAANGSRIGISPARPRAYAVNHATAYGGRDTVKVLMALLDQDALQPLCPNKADLLSDDQPALSGAEGTCMLSLFRSPEVSTGSSPEPLKNRVQSRLELLKPKAKDKAIRSQFACTYRDEDLPLNRVLEFPSSSQVSTCVHPAPKTLHTLPAVDETHRAKPAPESQNMGASVAQWGPSLGQRSGNAQTGRAAAPGLKLKSAVQTQKSNKRKQVDGELQGGSENQPPQKKQATSVPVKVSGRGSKVSKAASKKKLIAGQGTLSSFFRV